MKKTVFIITSLLSIDTLFAHSNLVAGGGGGSAKEGSVNFTLGQLDFSSSAGNSGSISQGMQQPYEVFVVGLENNKIQLSASVYPNPTINQLTLNVNDYQFDKLSLMLFDLQGKLIKQQTLNNASTIIDMSEFSQGTYFLKVLEAQTELQSFKVIKN